jgi:hypothetical protein
MNIDLNDAIVRLNSGNNYQVRDARGTCIHVHWGDLWITQEGDLKDHIVKTGESFAISNSGMTIVNAVNEAGVSVMEKCSESAIASAASIGTVVSSATQKAAETGAQESDLSADYAGNDVSQFGRRRPGVDELEQNLARAEHFRAHFVGDAIARVWNALRHSLGLVRELG